MRDYLEEIRWNKQPPVPSLPDEWCARTREKYVEAFRRLSGRELEVATVRDQLEGSSQEMVDKGVHYDDARREFEKMFIARALQRTKGNLGDAAEMLGLHRNTIARKIAGIPDLGTLGVAAGQSVHRSSRPPR